MLTIAVSSRSLFHLEDSNVIFERHGQAGYDEHMRESENELLKPGNAFELVRKLLELNRFAPPGERWVDVALLSRNSPDAGVRIMRSVMQHGLDIQKAVFTAGRNRFDYAREFKADLFLCASAEDAKKALDNGIAAARIQTTANGQCDNMAAECLKANTRNTRNTRDKNDTVRIAFDGDSVLFGCESDIVYREKGLEAFIAHEITNANVLLQAGPFKQLLQSLSDLQKKLIEHTDASHGQLPLQIGLVTARGVQSHARVLHTLRSWGISVNEVVFASGSPKGPLLRAFDADFFFDDTGRNVDSATQHDVAAAQVPFGEGGITTETAEVAGAPETVGAGTTPGAIESSTAVKQVGQSAMASTP